MRIIRDRQSARVLDNDGPLEQDAEGEFMEIGRSIGKYLHQQFGPAMDVPKKSEF